MDKFNNWLEKLDANPKTAWAVQLIKFGMVGITNTVVSYGVYALLVCLGMHYLVGSIAAFIISVAWSYILNSHFVFKESKAKSRIWWQGLLKAYVSYALTGIIVNNFLLYFWIDWIGLNKYFAYPINIIITVPMNFLLSKFWTFKEFVKES